MFVEPWSSRYFCRLAGGVPANPSLRTLWWTQGEHKWWAYGRGLRYALLSRAVTVSTCP
jgi:hypothetical protein